MKTKQILSTALAVVALMASCKKDDYRNIDSGQKTGVQFTSKIEGKAATKASGTSWSANDEIGVFMKQGSGLSNVLASNKKYVTAGNGNFSATGTDVINYPSSGNVDFIAYYPYSSSVTGNNLAINVSNQTNHENIDVMYSNNVTGQNSESGIANLSFTHKLSKIDITVSAGAGVTDLTGLSAVYNGIATTSTLDLATGNVAAGSGSANVNAKVSTAAADKLVEAILIPGDYSAKEVVFTVNGENFKWTLPSNTSYETGRRYTYNVQLQSGEAGTEVAVEGVATITDWNTVAGGETITIIKDGEEVIVTPEPEPEPNEGVEQTFFEESFGDFAGSTRPRIGAHTGYDVSTVKYSDLYTAEYGDVRKTSTMDTHIWLPAGRTTGLKIENINAVGYTDIVLSYSLASNAVGKPVEAVKVRVNGTDMTPTGVLGGQNVYSTQTISNVQAGTLTIEFDAAAAANENGFRLDNIKLVGKK